MSLADLPLLGPASETMLARADIRTEEQLRRLGAVEAFQLVRKSGACPSKNLLYALHGALNNLSWREASLPEVRSRLQLELEAYEDNFSDQ